MKFKLSDDCAIVRCRDVGVGLSVRVQCTSDSSLKLNMVGRASFFTVGLLNGFPVGLVTTCFERETESPDLIREGREL